MRIARDMQENKQGDWLWAVSDVVDPATERFCCHRRRSIRQGFNHPRRFPDLCGHSGAIDAEHNAGRFATDGSDGDGIRTRYSSGWNGKRVSDTGDTDGHWWTDDAGRIATGSDLELARAIGDFATTASTSSNCH